MNKNHRNPSALCGLSMAMVLGVGSVATAQKLPDQLNLPPQDPTFANTPAINFGFGDNTILGVKPGVAPLLLPGAMGALQIDPSLLVVLPRQYGWGPELNAIAPLSVSPPRSSTSMSRSPSASFSTSCAIRRAGRAMPLLSPT